jgi:hypothetical protein
MVYDAKPYLLPVQSYLDMIDLIMESRTNGFNCRARDLYRISDRVIKFAR